jgi:hypothetical protein
MTGAHANNWRWFNEAERHRQLTTRTQQASNLAASRKSPQTGRYRRKTPIRRKRTGASGLSQCAAGSVRAHGSEDLLAQRAARSLHALRALARLGARSSLICCGATNRISRSRGGGNDCPSPDECRPYCLDELAPRRANHTVEYRNGAPSA